MFAILQSGVKSSRPPISKFNFMVISICCPVVKSNTFVLTEISQQISYHDIFTDIYASQRICGGLLHHEIWMFALEKKLIQALTIQQIKGIEY